MKKVIFLCAACLFLTELSAQQAVSSSGGQGTGSGGATSFSVGQAAYVLSSGSGGTSSSGVQQTFEIVIDDSGLDEAVNDVLVKAYPNPTIDRLILEVANYSGEEFSYTITDVNGKVVQVSQFSTRSLELSLDDLSSGMYTLTVLNQAEAKQVIKLMKH